MKLIQGLVPLVTLGLASPLSFIHEGYIQPLLSQLISTKNLDYSINESDYKYSSSHGLSQATINELFKLHKLLVSSESVSGHEYEVGHKLTAYLLSKGLTVDHQIVDTKGRFNILAYKGSVNETEVLLTSHIDTVPPYFPYSVSEDGTKIYGRGATDAKASVASQVIAFLEILDSLEDGQVSLLFDVGEESGGDGFRYVANEIEYRWDSIIYGEPTENKLGVGHKGIYHGTVEVLGLSAHSGYPELGVDANKILVDFLSILGKQSFPSNDLLGKSFLNYGLIKGGVAGNVVSPTAEAIIAFRVPQDLGAYPKIIDSAIAKTPGGEHIRFTEGKIPIEPVLFEYDIPGFDSIVLGYGTDASALVDSPPKHSILYGPGSIHVAHGAGEFVSTDDLIEAVDGYKRLVQFSLKR